MKSYIINVTGTGQITIPVELRSTLNIQKGSQLSLRLNDEGTVTMEKLPDMPDWEDVLHNISVSDLGSEE